MKDGQPVRAELEESVRRHVRFSFSKSGGKGGQNVNKVSTKVLARLDLGAITCLSDEQRARIRQKLARRISEDGEIRLFADEERTQARNREIAIGRLVDLLERASCAPKLRRKTRPSRGARERRLAEKKHMGNRKRERRTPSDE